MYQGRLRLFGGNQRGRRITLLLITVLALFNTCYLLYPQNNDKIKLNNFRVYFQAQNLFTITKYTGADPENLGYAYPQPRTYTLGLSVGF